MVPLSALMKSQLRAAWRRGVRRALAASAAHTAAQVRHHSDIRAIDAVEGAIACRRPRSRGAPAILSIPATAADGTVEAAQRRAHAVALCADEQRTRGGRRRRTGRRRRRLRRAGAGRRRRTGRRRSPAGTGPAPTTRAARLQRDQCTRTVPRADARESAAEARGSYRPRASRAAPSKTIRLQPRGILRNVNVSALGPAATGTAARFAWEQAGSDARGAGAAQAGKGLGAYLVGARWGQEWRRIGSRIGFERGGARKRCRRCAEGSY